MKSEQELLDMIGDLEQAIAEQQKIRATLDEIAKTLEKIKDLDYGTN